MDLSLGHRDALKNTERVFLYELREIALPDQLANLRMIAAMGVPVISMVVMFVPMLVMMMLFAMRMIVVVMFMMLVLMRSMAFLSVLMMMFMRMLMLFVVMLLLMLILVMRMGGAFMDPKLDALDALALLALKVHVKIADIELRQLPFKRGRFHS